MSPVQPRRRGKLRGMERLRRVDRGSMRACNVIMITSVRRVRRSLATSCLRPAIRYALHWKAGPLPVRDSLCPACEDESLPTASRTRSRLHTHAVMNAPLTAPSPPKIRRGQPVMSQQETMAREMMARQAVERRAHVPCPLRIRPGRFAYVSLSSLRLVCPFSRLLRKVQSVTLHVGTHTATTSPNP